MKPSVTPSRSLHWVLWIAQIVVAASLIWSASLKLGQPINQLAILWPWVGQVPVALVRVTGLVDLLGALGLILPAWLRVQPRLTPLSAMGVVGLMVAAGIFHLVRGEASSIGVNIGFALLAGFIAWGRLTKVPIVAR